MRARHDNQTVSDLETLRTLILAPRDLSLLEHVDYFHFGDQFIYTRMLIFSMKLHGIVFVSR